MIWTNIIIRSAVTVRNRRIHFSATGTPDVYEGAAFVQNKFPGLPLRFHAFLGDNNMGYRDYLQSEESQKTDNWLIVQPATGYIEWPNSDQRVRVIADVSKMPREIDLSQFDHVLHVVDLDHYELHSSRRPLIFPKVLDMRQSSADTENMESAVSDASEESVEAGIVVGGCEKRFGNRFELDLGTQSYSSGRVRGMITLGNQTDKAIQYRIKPIKETDLRWLSLSHSSGKIQGKSSISVVVWCSTDVLAVHSSYIVLENLDDDRDVKLIRLKMDVVQQHLDEVTSFFSLYASKTDDEGWDSPSIDLGDVYYDHLYRARSFVIRNNTNKPLEVGMHVNQNDEDPSELQFSTSYTMPKLVSNVTLGTLESKSIHVFFCPRPRENQESWVDTFDFEAELSVNCRLVKESEKRIPFRCRIHSAQLQVVPRQSEFDLKHIDRMRKSLLESDNGGEEFAEAIVMLKEQSHRFKINNLFGNKKPLVVGVYTNSSYVHLLDQEGNKLKRGDTQMVSGNEELVLELIPDTESLQRNWRQVLEDQYLEEHIYVYNAEEMSEKYLYRVRFETGEPLTELYSMPGDNLNRPLTQMEDHISQFFIEFTGFWNGMEKRLNAMMEVQEGGDELYWENMSELVSDESVQSEELLLYREFHFLTDELIYHGLRSNRMSRHVFELSDVVFGFVLNQGLFDKYMTSLGGFGSMEEESQGQEMLHRWVNRALAFLNHFPDVKLTWLARKIGK
eukprot:TRINITY_DN1280_c0_g1_i8.p1 TRINITY_DN1280_c0_g1~~TRINITY_DN1280_c0_g1_i8.p1  ORF type:complete len:732 (-),score=266.08 TRINITY_DN1280_c0_g1_i8:2905-5100(-)